nr:MAG TPA: hypothetical protein [Caudoviricetes sp.]
MTLVYDRVHFKQPCLYRYGHDGRQDIIYIYNI